MANKLFYFFVLLFSTTVKSQTVITDVTVVDVENNQLLPHQSVLIEGNTIKTIVPSTSFKIPVNAKKIVGTNKFLLPGLIDAHAHPWDGDMYSDDGIDLTKYKPASQAIEEFKARMGSNYKRFLQCGITTIISPGSTISTHRISDSLALQSPMPSIYMAGRLITVSNFGNDHNFPPDDEYYDYADNVEAAKSIVQKQLAYHVSFIKILFVPDLAFKHIEDSARAKSLIVKAIINEAHKAGLRVAVHATERITAQLAVEAGCDYLVHGIHDELINDDFIQLLKQKNIVFCPTSNVEYPILRAYTQKPAYTNFELSHSNPFVLKTFFDLVDLDSTLYQKTKKIWEANKKIFRRDSIRLVNLKRLSDAGVRIAAGTDVGSLGNMPGTSFLPELLKMKQSGMTNWQIIGAATFNPTFFINKESLMGKIAQGKIADMILLNKNPVADLENLTDISLVFKNGVAIAPDTLLIETPDMTVQRLWNAYNAKSSQVFLACFEPGIKVYNSSALMYKGLKEVETKWRSQLQPTSAKHCEINSRIVSGDTVVDKLTIKEPGKPSHEQIIVYKINRQKIKSVTFIQ